MCEGVVYHGYKGGCVDFQPMSPSLKWIVKLGSFADRQASAIKRMVKHTFFHDGEGEDCATDCDDLAAGAGAAAGVALMVACVAVTDGLGLAPCLSGYTSIAAGGAAVVVGGVSLNHVAKARKKNMCTK